MNIAQALTAPGVAEAVSLLDILPLRNGDADDSWQHLSFEFNPAAGVALAVGSQCDPATRDEWLCAALALVESRLSGADRVLATLLTASGARQAWVEVPFEGRFDAWRGVLSGVLGDTNASPESVTWAVLDGIAVAESPASMVASAWRLHLVDRPWLEVAFRAPLGVEAITLLADCTLRVLAQFREDGDLASIDTIDPVQRQCQLGEWNDTAQTRSTASTVHRQFTAIRNAYPEALAVLDTQSSLTYAELDQRADTLARQLRTADVRPGSIVAVAMKRSVDSVIAVLGVLKAGAAYLPVDLTHPPRRLGAMLEDAGVQVVVTGGGGDTRCLPASVKRIEAIRSDGRDGVWVTTDDIISNGDSLAYVMYTSGSTGTPKGVEICHRSILRLVCDVDYIGLGPDVRMLHAAPLGFDASTLELWGALLNGGCVVVHDELVPTGPGLATIIARHGVTTAWLTAALFNAVVDADPHHLAGLRELFIGGEALSVDHVRRMQRAAPGLRLCNGYGPTECTTFTCTHPIPHDILQDATSIPIGRPLPATRVYVLNARRHPVPVGVSGELYVGGEGLARGYLNCPELTAERFVRDPFGASDERLYRTGDMVRYRPDGVIEFVGRLDNQVKIRGFRIEPGEIESALARHPAVQACTVVATAGPSGEKRLVAYFVATADMTPPTTAGLRAHLSAVLPEFMVPARYMQVDALPMTANGKLDRAALPMPDRDRPQLACAFEPPADATERRICMTFGALLDIDPVGRHDNFFELGGNSLLALRLLEQLRNGHAPCIAATTLFRNPTPAALAAALQGRNDRTMDPSRMASTPVRGGEDDRDNHRNAPAHEPVAIIAMAGRFPGAADVEAFWQNLCEGRDSITVFRPDELDPGVGAADRNDPAYVMARGVIEDVENFDAAFFGISPKEAELMDPQQRVFLELCWECLERGGHAPDATPGPVGVFAGMYNATYLQRHVAARPDLIDKIGAFQVMLDNEKDYIATRVAHKLNLTGPAITVQSGCSTSLVAICQAVASLRAGGCDMALAGGASITCPPRSGYLYQEGAMLSPDGHTRTFDARAQGTVFSDGAAVVLLKRLSDARTDGNPVYAVIRGGAINNDGGNKASFTAPSSEGQAAVIAMAHDNARVDPRSIGYVETHGTATPLGDPIEIEGLTKAFRRGTDDIGFCRIGSVKSNIGHTVIAAGAAGAIKAALALQERKIPGTVHYESPNPTIDFAGSPFVVSAGLSEWHGDGVAPRRAGVSSFGVGGTNAHAVLEEAPPLPASEPAGGPQLLVLSARTPAALGQAVTRLALHLESQPGTNLADVAWTLSVGRKAFAHRVAVVADDIASAITMLRSPETSAAAARSRPARSNDVVFLFPGQGATYAGMGRALYAAEPAFRAAFDECADVLRVGHDIPGLDLRTLMFSDDPEALRPTAVMQPATFTIEYALARLWMSLGITPVAMIGHSVGEFVAATLAGVFALPDAVRLVARRGALMQAQPAGSMLSVRIALDALRPRLPPDVSLAAENAPGACVVSGPGAAIAQFQAQLEAEGIACRALRTSHAFHSAMMDPVVAPFLAEVAAIARSAPHLPLVSTATGDWLDAATAMSPDYWTRHLREPVRFATALTRVLDVSSRVLLEVGPRATLCSLSRQHPNVQAQHIAAIASLADTPQAELPNVRTAAGQLWSHGVPFDPAVFDLRRQRRRLRLPTYPFERQRYWIEAAVPVSNVVAHPAIATSTTLETVMPPVAQSVVTPALAIHATTDDRRPRLIAKLKEVLEDVAGFDLADADTDANFIELGLDSLMLTQIALQLQKTFALKITFRQLMGEGSSLDRLAALLDAQLPADAAQPALPVAAKPSSTASPLSVPAMPTTLVADAAGGDYMRQVIAQQMQLMAQQLALLAGNGALAAAVASPDIPATAAASAPLNSVLLNNAPPNSVPGTEASDEEATLAHTKYDVKKAFGAIARIDNNARFDLSERQRSKLDAFIARYVARTRKSKDYTQAQRRHMADPRVVNGFRPLLKEIVYQIVIERSKGAHLWDLDGNDYVDALNGFGMSLFGWQPDFVLDAVHQQLELGYEIGPQHPLAGDVARLVCEVTGHDRAALCNTGSEAVLGALRIARTVTGRETVVLFSGSYHGIIDEMLVRGTRKLRAVPAAPGILRNTSEHVMVLDYGTPESMQIIRERAHEIAAVLVEPVQSRRPDFQPREFLRELRQVTQDAGALLVFDEVVTGFRAHPAGVQGLFGIQADLATYGKVVGGGYPIGVIAGKRDCMDALDGGDWQFGDNSVPSVGVTYFAGTFVRHPLALAAAKAILTHIQQQGPQLQERLNTRVAAMADELNAFCADNGAPVAVKQFASVWKTQFLEDHPLQDLLFAMMRSRGVHILDNFPCFLTTAHSEEDFQRIIQAFKDSLIELQEAEFLPRHSATPRTVMDASQPMVAGARLGREPDGRPAWFVPHPEHAGKYVKVSR